MQATFLFDTFLLKKSDDYYAMTLTNDFFKRRYLKYYDKIIVCTRVKEMTSEKGNYDGYKIVNGENVEVKPISLYSKISDAFVRRKKIKEQIWENIKNSDVAIIRLPSMIGILACDICRKKKKNYIIEMVACAWDGYINHHNKFGKIIAPYMFLETRRVVKKAPKVLYVTNNFLQKRYPTQGKSYACSDVEIENIDNNVLKDRIKKIENMNKNDTIKLCTVANVGLKYKGQEYVIKALKILKEKGKKNYLYYLVGNGNNSYLKNMVQKYGLDNEVKFVGSLSHKSVFDFLKSNVDIYIQPSLQEGLPRSLIEAMSLGIPSFASNAGGNTELVEENCIFNKKDYMKIASLLENIKIDKLKDMTDYNIKKAENYRSASNEQIRKSFYKIENGD